MPTARNDVNRLFKHFGLNPSDYTSFSDKALSPANRQAVGATPSTPRPTVR